MTRKLKGFSIVLIVVVGVCLLAMLGFKSLVGSIRNARTCDWANIDNVEIYCYVDVPNITTSDCDYNAVTNTKTAYFKIDEKGFDSKKYISTFGFKQLDDFSELKIYNFLNFTKDSLDLSRLYFKYNTKSKSSNSIAIYDGSNRQLWVSIIYDD